MRNLVVLTFSMTLALIGCAKNTAVEESAKAPASKYTPQENVQTQWIACGQSSAGAANVLNANQMMVMTASGQSGSLCQALASSGQDVAIFQFAGLFCSSCKDEARWINSQPMNGFSHSLVFTDSREEMDQIAYNDFRQLAPKSKYFHDFDKSLANELNPGKQFGTVLVLHKSGEYRLHLSPGLEQQWYADANELVRKYQGASNSQNSFGPIRNQNIERRNDSYSQNQARPNWNYGFTY